MLSEILYQAETANLAQEELKAEAEAEAAAEVEEERQRQVDADAAAARRLREQTASLGDLDGRLTANLAAAAEMDLELQDRFWGPYWDAIDWEDEANWDYDPEAAMPDAVYTEYMTLNDERWALQELIDMDQAKKNMVNEAKAADSNAKKEAARLATEAQQAFDKEQAKIAADIATALAAAEREAKRMQQEEEKEARRLEKEEKDAVNARLERQMNNIDDLPEEERAALLAEVLRGKIEARIADLEVGYADRVATESGQF